MFSHWMVDDEIIYDKIYSFIIYNNKNVIPYFVPERYTITLEAVPQNCGYFTPYPYSTFAYGEEFTVVAAPFPGYRFVRWEDGFYSAERNVEVVSNVALVALFEPTPEEHTITIVLPDSTYNCYVYYNGVNIGAHLDNTVVFKAIQDTTVAISPITTYGKKIISITDSYDNIVFDYDDTNIRKGITYTVGDTDETLTVNFGNINYGLAVTMQPLNNDTSAQIVISMNIGGTYYNFNPSISNSVYRKNDILYDTEIVLTTLPTLENNGNRYTFAYWTTDIGTFIASSITFSE